MGWRPRHGAISASSARTVTLTQAALLAGLLKAPSRYAPTRNVELATARVDVVLDNMVEAGFLTAAEAHAAAEQPLKLQGVRRRDGIPLRRRLGGRDAARVRRRDNEGDLIVETTIDAGLQRVAQATLRQKLDEEGKRARRERRRRGGARPSKAGSRR